LAEKIYKIVLPSFAVIGWIIGYFLQNFYVTVGIIGAGFALCCLLILPPLPYLTDHQIKFEDKPLPEKTEDKEGKEKKEKKEKKEGKEKKEKKERKEGKEKKESKKTK